MILVSTILMFFKGASPVLHLTFSDPMLKSVLMHFPNSSREGNFKRLA